MTPKQKAVEVLHKQDFNTRQVLIGLAAKYPQEFLKLVEKYRKELPVVQEPDPSLYVTVMDLIRQNKYVGAIKEVRYQTGKSLRDAKDYVDNIKGHL